MTHHSLQGKNKEGERDKDPRAQLLRLKQKLFGTGQPPAPVTSARNSASSLSILLGVSGGLSENLSVSEIAVVGT